MKSYLLYAKSSYYVYNNNLCGNGFQTFGVFAAKELAETAKTALINDRFGKNTRIY